MNAPQLRDAYTKLNFIVAYAAVSMEMQLWPVRNHRRRRRRRQLADRMVLLLLLEIISRKA